MTKLELRLKGEIVLAMKAKKVMELDILRLLSSELAANSSRPKKSKMTEVQIIRKMISNAREMDDEEEALFLEEYAPVIFNEDQTKKVINAILLTMTAPSMRDMGVIMGKIKSSKFAPNINNKVASKIIKDILS